MDMLAMPPLEDYHGNTTADANNPKHRKKKKNKKKLKNLKKKLENLKKKTQKSKLELKMERQLNIERDRRYQAEADLKCIIAMLQIYSGASLPALPESSCWCQQGKEVGS